MENVDHRRVQVICNLVFKALETQGASKMEDLQATVTTMQDSLRNGQFSRAEDSAYKILMEIQNGPKCNSK